MIASDIMSKNVISVQPDDSVAKAVRLMLQHRVSGLPVITTAGALVGVISEGNLLRRNELSTQRQRSGWLEFFTSSERVAEEYVKAASRQIDEVMAVDVISVTPSARLEEIVSLMEKHGIKRVPVVEGERVIGIVTRADLLRALASAMCKVPRGALPDDAIKQGIYEELSKQSWASLGKVNIEVVDGVVTLGGTIYDERLHKAVLVASKNAQGVRRVVDDMVWIEPVAIAY